jgi:small GTP-binding protein
LWPKTLDGILHYGDNGYFADSNGRVTALNLESCQLTDITPLQGLGNLTWLVLGHNHLTDITPLKGLINLTQLDLRNNRIKELPEAFIFMDLEIEMDSELFYGDSISLYGNPLERPPIEIIRKGKEAMFSWFRSQDGEQKQALNEVKVVLVGEGSAGKTSLVKRLLGQDFSPMEPMTHGINIDPWQVKTIDTEITARLWDFGGQEIMHATHQFFLSKRSLYILVLDGRKDERTEYWLKHIQSFGGDSPTLVVINKIDQNCGFDLNSPFLQNKYKNIKGFFPVSCKDGTGIDTFHESLIDELGQVEMIHTTWGQSWFNVKTALENMKDHYINFRQYREICLKENIREAVDGETLVEFLHDLGIVLHFKEFDLCDTHVLNPGWATGAVYKIVTSNLVVYAKGVLHLDDLNEILAKEMDEDYEYPRDKYRYILTLMEKFELCYRLDKNRVLIPDLLVAKEPEFEFDHDNALHFIIQYDFLPPSVLPRFIVNMHKEIKDGLQWRTGVVLEDTDFKAVAVVKADQDARRITIDVSGDQKRDYFALVLATLRRINRSFEKLKTTELIPMPDDPEITANYKQLIRFEKEGIEFYFPGESEKKYKVIDLLGTVATPKTGEAEILKYLEKIKTDTDTIESLLRKAEDLFILQPNFMGMGINVKNVKSAIKKLLSKKDQDLKD